MKCLMNVSEIKTTSLSLLVEISRSLSVLKNFAVSLSHDRERKIKKEKKNHLENGYDQI